MILQLDSKGVACIRKEVLTVVKLGDEVSVEFHKQLLENEELLKQVVEEVNKTVEKLKNMSEEEKQEALKLFEEDDEDDIDDDEDDGYDEYW